MKSVLLEILSHYTIEETILHLNSPFYHNFFAVTKCMIHSMYLTLEDNLTQRD